MRAGTSSPCGFETTRRWSFVHEVVTSRGSLARIRCRRSSVMRTLFKAIPVALIVVTGTTACASKKFVRTSVGEVNDKVDSLGRSVEETQERTRQNEGKIADVDARAQAAAQAATQEAKVAQDSASKANDQASQASNSANSANAKADAIDKASKRLVYEVVLSEDEGNFKFGKKELPDEAKAKLDEMINQLKADPK